MNMEPDKNEYQYVFVMTDIFGKSYYSDTATFIKQGNIFRAIKTEPSTLDHTTE